MGKVGAELQCLVGALIAAFGLYCFSAVDDAKTRVLIECLIYITEQGKIECQDAQLVLQIYELGGPICSAMGAIIVILGIVEYSKASEATKVISITTPTQIAASRATRVEPNISVDPQSPPFTVDDWTNFVKMVDEILGLLPDENTVQLYESEDFELYKRVVSDPSQITTLEKSRFVHAIDELLGNCPEEYLSGWVNSTLFELYRKIVRKYGK
jgi:hypothetical protein